MKTTERTKQWLALRASKLGWWSRLRVWLAFKLIGGGLPIDVEVRHGAYRARSRSIWNGNLVRAEIPVDKLPVDRNDRAIVDAFTGVSAYKACRACGGKGFEI